jgi:hypothetical protein
LIKFDPFWADLVQKNEKNKAAIFILSVNVTAFYSNIFRLLRKSNMIKFDPFWTDLILKKSKNKTAIFILSVNVTTFYSNNFGFVKSLIHFGQI